MSKYSIILLVVFIPFINGCVSEPIKLGTPQTTEIVDIKLTPNNVYRIDKMIQPSIWGDVISSVETGPIWNSVFVGTELSEASFEILSAFIDVELGYSGTWTYIIKGQVLCGENTYPISAQGSRSAAWALESAMRQSVERGVSNAAKKAKFIVEACINKDKNFVIK